MSKKLNCELFYFILYTHGEGINPGKNTVYHMGKPGCKRYMVGGKLGGGGDLDF